MPTPTGSSESWWNQSPLPEGVVWYLYPTDDTPGSIAVNPRQVMEYPDTIVRLRQWAADNNLHIGLLHVQEVYTNTTYVNWPRRFLVAPIQEGETEEDFCIRRGAAEVPWESAIECPVCQETHPAYTTVCRNGDGGYLACANCGRGLFQGRVNEQHHITFGLHGREMASLLVCSNCGGGCQVEGCSNWSMQGSYCGLHGQHARCDVCDVSLEAPLDAENPWFTSERYAALCNACSDSICPNCNYYTDHDLSYSGDLGGYVCRHCFREALAGSGTEEFDNGATMSNRRLRIPSIPGRENIRMCGVEIEGANAEGNGETLAEALYEAGLSRSGEMHGYHHGSSSGFAHVERDSSVDWEAVMGPINPADANDVRQLNQAVRTIRQLVKDGVLSLDLRAGCHIHVEAAGVSLDGAFNLNTLFAYAEDVIYRLAAAKWPIHRAIQGSDYTRPVPKEHRKLAFARSTEREGSRYYALSFNNYFSQMLGNCSCGAVRYDSWEDCTCDLGKCTFEFRVFNTTANPRKLHAYLALTQALVAKAMRLGPLSNPADEFPALPFVSRRFKDMAEADQAVLVEDWKERLMWMFTELPLTDVERDSLRYCVVNSELASVGEDFINELIPVAAEQQVIEEVAA
ncbi:MAG: amidoligase family protein [Patescibacteria group bacterium]|nr:amidoligase family protein [Patescibacteria group bacterium]